MFRLYHERKELTSRSNELDAACYRLLSALDAKLTAKILMAEVLVDLLNSEMFSFMSLLTNIVRVPALRPAPAFRGGKLAARFLCEFVGVRRVEIDLLALHGLIGQLLSAEHRLRTAGRHRSIWAEDG